MFKLVGALLIIGGCGFLGLRVARIYRQRTALLRLLQNGLTLLETEINYLSTPLPLALHRVGERLSTPARILFARAAEILGQDRYKPAAWAWEKGVTALSRELPLTEQEISILTLFGYGLGCSDKEEQLKNINLARQQLHLAAETAAAAQEKNQKMWQYLGFGLGSVLALILI